MTFSFGSVSISSITELNEFWSGMSCSHCCFPICKVFMALGIIIFYAFCALLLSSSVHLDVIVRRRSCFLLDFESIPFLL